MGFLGFGGLVNVWACLLKDPSAFMLHEEGVCFRMDRI